jgi:lipid II:glycine glycyltransferase (peptidoglycan interpeptide bridge formation enzyme)
LSAWAALKSPYGWSSERVLVTGGGGAQILFRRLPLGLGTIAYVPYGPVVNWAEANEVKKTLGAIHQAARQHRALFLKIEPGYELPPGLLPGLGFRPSPQTVQPPRTVLIDLDEDEAMLKRMNQGTRRNIRKSEKFEVQVRQGARAEVASFNAMLDETGRRNDFGVHVAAYYEQAYELFVPSGDGALLLASYGGVDLAGVFVFRVGDWAWYLYGASRDAERERMAPYAAQWAGLQWARSKGCRVYDLYGIPDEDEAALESQFEARQDGLWGVYRFKRGWGGRVARTAGAWDYVYSPPLYWAYQQYLKRRPGVSD